MNHKLLSDMLDFTQYIAACASTSNYESDIIAEIRKIQPQIKVALAAPERSGKTADEVRNEVLEEAALACDRDPIGEQSDYCSGFDEAVFDCVKRIRALKSAPAASSEKTADEAAIKTEYAEYLDWCVATGKKSMLFGSFKSVWTPIPAASSSAAPYNKAQLATMDAKAIAGCSPKHIESVITGLIATVLAAPSVQAVAAGQELTDADIERMWREHVVPVFGMNGINANVFARAIERHLTKPPALAGDTQAGE